MGAITLRHGVDRMREVRWVEVGRPQAFQGLTQAGEASLGRTHVRKSSAGIRPAAGSKTRPYTKNCSGCLRGAAIQP